MNKENYLDLYNRVRKVPAEAKKEIWKDIPGYEGFYQASTLGRIRSVDRRVYSKSGSRLAPGTIRSPRIGSRGYMNIYLSRDGKKRIFTIHRIIATTFIENPNNLPIINHKNGNPSDNRVSNLEWCDLFYNYVHASEVLGRNCGTRRVLCVESGEIYNSIHDAARKLGVTVTAVHRAINRTNGMAGGRHVQYADNNNHSKK